MRVKQQNHGYCIVPAPLGGMMASQHWDQELKAYISTSNHDITGEDAAQIQ